MAKGDGAMNRWTAPVDEWLKNVSEREEGHG